LSLNESVDDNVKEQNAHSVTHDVTQVVQAGPADWAEEAGR